MTSTPDSHITIEPCRSRVRAIFANHIIADTDEALMLREGDLPPVYYFPVEDVEMGYLGATERHTSCPYKGQASYFTILIDGEIGENAAWSYPEPISGVEVIRGRLAFDTGRVEVYEIDEQAIDAGLGHQAARTV